MSFSEQDHEYMALAMSEARAALDAGDYPVGAVLAVNGEFIGKARNSVFSETQTTAHAEQNLLREYSALLRQSVRNKTGDTITVYTTLEPCLMCLGGILIHHVTRIVYACPDPHGGAVSLDVGKIGSFYAPFWPNIEAGLMREESVDLMIGFFKSQKTVLWKTALDRFVEMKANWQV